MPHVDIVMPLYNKAETVRRAIRSIQHQSVTDWRLIVVDDGSTDQGPDIVAALDDDRITIIRQENQGPGAARNRGIALAQSEFLSFLDADDEWYPWFLENSLKAIQENDVAMVASMYYLWPQKQDMTEFWAKRSVRTGIYHLQGNEDPVWVNKLRGVFLAWNVLMYTETARKYDGFYEKNHCMSGEDTTFFLRVLFGEPVMLIEPPAVRYHTETSELGFYLSRPRPIPPYLIEPETVLKYCPSANRKLLLQLLDYMALLSARQFARWGMKKQAQSLLDRFPGTKIHEKLYKRCRYEILVSCLMPNWIRFKYALRLLIMPVLKLCLHNNRTLPELPTMPYEES
ncbi:MAG: glycosyltransferase family 2 protein [Sedimentisphaerales bacterium]|nr:glycosyltransferase family 2 protein [Sedimentisphaerales bacterium]